MKQLLIVISVYLLLALTLEASNPVAVNSDNPPPPSSSTSSSIERQVVLPHENTTRDTSVNLASNDNDPLHTMTCTHDTATFGLIHCLNGNTYYQSGGSTSPSNIENEDPGQVLRRRSAPTSVPKLTSKAPDTMAPQTCSFDFRNPSMLGGVHENYGSGGGDVYHRYPNPDLEAGWSKYSGGHCYDTGILDDEYYSHDANYGSQGYRGPDIGRSIYSKRFIVPERPGGDLRNPESDPTVVHVPININTLVYPDGRMVLMPSSETLDTPRGVVGSGIF
ncbi:hypothetical protein BGZ76_005418 [Entomortierella beljakovae]|nr:hypothetical protein BGZ76_005418 [Entomortierella beljakovae]